MTEEEKKFIINLQLNNICEILDGKLNHQQVIDSKGNASRRIIIEYQEKSNAGLDLQQRKPRM